MMARVTPAPTIQAVVESTRAAFLRAARLLVPAVALPALAGTLALERAHGNASPLLLVQAASFVLFVAGAWLTLRWHAVSSAFLVALVVVQAVTSVAMYGPLAGNGALVLSGCLLAIAFYGWRVGLAVSVGALALWSSVLAAMGAGWLPTPDPRTSSLDSPATWVRTGISLFVATALIVALYALVQRALVRSVEEATEARARAIAAAGEREEAFRALADAQRVQSIGYLAGGLAHDIRNTLTVVLASVNLLRDHPTAAQAVAGDLELAAQNGIESTRRLLALARDAREGRCRPSEVLSGLSRILGPVLPLDVQLRMEAPPTRAVAMSEGALAQAVLNLAVNARDAMPDGGVLTLRAVDEGAPHPITVEVQDTGAGMDPATLSRAFEPFFTTKPGGRGTGLGLPMVKRTAEEAGGSVEVESAPGRGPRVRLVLPPADAGTQAAT